MELNGRRCPIGAANFDGAIRHAVDFSWFQKPYNIPKELEQFTKFVHNTTKKRISFVTANNSGCIEINPKNVFSIDKTNIDEFNRIAIDANPHLDWTSALKNPRSVSYDFADRESDDANIYTLWSRIQEQGNKTGENLTKGFPLLTYAAIGIGIKLLWDKLDTPKRKT